LSVGVAFAVLAVSPGLLDWAAGRVGVDYQPALLFLVGMVFLLLVVVHLSWELSRLEERTRVLAEELSLLRTDVTDGVNG
jgi:sensor domain CHASE-containing protein